MGDSCRFRRAFPGYNGGGVANYGGTLTVRNSILYVNRAGEDAGPFSFRIEIANQVQNELKGFVPRGALLSRHAPHEPKPFGKGQPS